MPNRSICEACDGTGEALEARPVSLRDAIDDAANDMEAHMHLLAAKGSDLGDEDYDPYFDQECPHD